MCILGKFNHFLYVVLGFVDDGQVEQPMDRKADDLVHISTTLTTYLRCWWDNSDYKLQVSSKQCKNNAIQELLLDFISLSKINIKCFIA